MTDASDQSAVVPFAGSLPVARRGLELLESWRSNRIRLLFVEGRQDVAEAIRQRLGQEPDIELLPIAANHSQALAIAERERPTVIVIDSIGMPVEATADVTVDLFERLPSAALITLDDEDTPIPGKALGATMSIPAWAVGLSPAWVVNQGPLIGALLDLARLVRVTRDLDVETPARVLQRIRRSAGLLRPAKTPPSHLLLGANDLPTGWRHWDELPPHDSDHTTSCARGFILGDRPSLATPVLHISLDVYPTAEQAIAVIKGDREHGLVFGNGETIEGVPGNEAFGQRLSFVPPGIRLRARSACSLITLWSVGLDSTFVIGMLKLQLARVEDGATDVVATDGPLILNHMCGTHYAVLTGSFWCSEGEHQVSATNRVLGYEYEPGSHAILLARDLGRLQLDGNRVKEASRAIFQRIVAAKVQGRNYDGG